MVLGFSLKLFYDSISCGPNHNLLLSRDGDIYVFGDMEQIRYETRVGNEKHL
jgi:alpha-tubulin suppressor-like RCC1 family protein